jgi:hypothetical protein
MSAKEVSLHSHIWKTGAKYYFEALREVIFGFLTLIRRFI